MYNTFVSVRKANTTQCCHHHEVVVEEMGVLQMVLQVVQQKVAHH
jgi:hypothetical protein